MEQRIRRGTIMERSQLALGLFLLGALPVAAQQHDKPLVTFQSPTECQGARGTWRWAAKSDIEMPPSSIAANHHIKPSDIAAWQGPQREVTAYSPRFGRELEWFAVIGRVAQVKAEEDGDLYIELRDADNPHGIRVVVEVPLDRHGGKTPWNPIRQTVFGWSDQTFPFEARAGHKLNLTAHPLIEVTGHAFYDAPHRTIHPNRRTSHTAVWEIHPVMVLYVLRHAD